MVLCANRYTGDRTKRLLGRFPLEDAVNPADYEAFKAGGLSKKNEEAFRQRLFFGNKVSNARLLHRAVAEDWDHGIIFEDDAVVVPDFANQLEKVLCDLPHDWDVLMLNGECTREMTLPHAIYRAAWEAMPEQRMNNTQCVFFSERKRNSVKVMKPMGRSLRTTM